MNQLSQWEATIKFHIMNLLNVNCKKKKIMKAKTIDKTNDQKR